jgi:hypothetical protein
MAKTTSNAVSLDLPPTHVRRQSHIRVYAWGANAAVYVNTCMYVYVYIKYETFPTHTHVRIYMCMQEEQKLCIDNDQLYVHAYAMMSCMYTHTQ